MATTGAASQEEAARKKETARLARLAEAAQREQGEQIARLRKALASNNLAICVGAGVTLYTTALPPTLDGKRKSLRRLTWTGLIENGLDYLVNFDHLEQKDYPMRMRHAYEALENNDSDQNLFEAVNNMKDMLSEKKIFPTWLGSMFCNLHTEKRYTSILDALKMLHENGAMLLTTNYDGLIEEHCGLATIDGSDSDQLAMFMAKNIDGVFHPHGHWLHPATIVLDSVDYYKVKEVATNVQVSLKNILQQKTVLFVGCGGTIHDPNFGPLLDWIGEQGKNIVHNHCLVLREDDKNLVAGKPLVPLRCGKEYDDIAPFLEKLLEKEVAIKASTSKY